MAPPTVGRIVHYRYDPEAGGDDLPGGPGPLAAVVTCVHSDTMVNLAVFDANGEVHSRTSVELVEPTEEAPHGQVQAGVPAWCTWPPRV